MNERLDRSQIFIRYLEEVIGKSRGIFPELLGCFIIDRALQVKYIRVYALFVTQTEKMEVETEIETWFKIYEWMEEKKDAMLRQFDAQKHMMIVLYPRFINAAEFYSLPEPDRERLEYTTL